MNILIDIDELEKTGIVSPALASTLREHAIKNTGSAAINMLLAFGAIAIAAGIFALRPSPVAAAFFGFGFIALGWLTRKQYPQWEKLGAIWMMVGSLVVTSVMFVFLRNPFLAPLAAAVLLFLVSLASGSRLLMALVPLTLASAIGGSTGYWQATYSLTVREPALTITLFTALGIATWQVAKRLRGTRHALAITFARMCVLLANFGFWIGSLWGDSPGRIWRNPHGMPPMVDFSPPQISALTFSVCWAATLIAAGAWGAKRGRRFMVNTAATFGAIHFYTQWFERLGMQPVSVIVAGVAAVAFGMGLWRYNRRQLGAA